MSVLSSHDFCILTLLPYPAVSIQEAGKLTAQNRDLTLHRFAICLENGEFELRVTYMILTPDGYKEDPRRFCGSVEIWMRQLIATADVLVTVIRTHASLFLQRTQGNIPSPTLSGNRPWDAATAGRDGAKRVSSSLGTSNAGVSRVRRCRSSTGDWHS